MLVAPKTYLVYIVEICISCVCYFIECFTGLKMSFQRPFSLSVWTPSQRILYCLLLYAVGHVRLRYPSGTVLFQAPRGISSGPVLRWDHIWWKIFSKDGSSHPKKQPESSDFEGDPVAHLQMFPETCPEIHKVPLWSQLTPANLFTISWRTQDICDSHSFKFQWKNWHKPYILLGMEQRTAILHVEFPNVCQSMMNLQPARLTLRWSAKKKASSWKIWMEQWCGMLL